MATLDSLSNGQLKITKDIETLYNKIASLEEGHQIFVSKAELADQLNQITLVMNDYNKVLSDVETKLSKIILPDNTRFYLESSEITQFRDNFRKLRLLMSELDKSREAFIRLASRYNLTNSKL